MMRVFIGCFAGKLGKSVFLYIDEICLANETWNSHSGTLEDTLKTLRENNVTCNPSKCKLAMSGISNTGRGDHDK